MLKRGFTKVVIFTAGIFLVLLFLLPDSFQARFNFWDRSDIDLQQSEQVKSSPSDENFGKIEKPVYFSIFKFITGFIPSKQKQTFF